jgi:hypothetical protein
LQPSHRQIRAFLHFGQLKLSESSPGLTSLPQALQLGMSYEPAYIFLHAYLPRPIFTFVGAGK